MLNKIKPGIISLSLIAFKLMNHTKKEKKTIVKTITDIYDYVKIMTLSDAIGLHVVIEDLCRNAYNGNIAKDEKKLLKSLKSMIVDPDLKTVTKLVDHVWTMISRINYLVACGIVLELSEEETVSLLSGLRTVVVEISRDKDIISLSELTIERISSQQDTKQGVKLIETMDELEKNLKSVKEKIALLPVRFSLTELLKQEEPKKPTAVS